MFRDISKKIGCLGLLVCLSGLASVDSGAEEKLRLQSVPYDLSIQNEDKGHISINGDSIVISAMKGTDLYTDPQGKTHADNTPRLMFRPQGDFIFSAKVSAPLNTAYDGGALLIYADENHWAKLLFERFKSGRNGISTDVAIGTGDGAYHGTRPGTHQYLKVVRYGNAYIFYSSEDGAQWHFLRHFAFEADGPVKVGFTAQAPIAESLKVEFSDVKYRPETFKDFWQGK